MLLNQKVYTYCASYWEKIISWVKQEIDFQGCPSHIWAAKFKNNGRSLNLCG